MKKYLLIFLILVSSNAFCTTFNITVNTRFFAPNSINAAVGDTLKFQWVEGFHTTTCDGTNGSSLPPGAAPWNSDMNSSSPTFMYIINTIGSYHFVCIFHAPSMAGDVTAILPVELTNFNAITINNNVILKWTTNFEINNSGFDVERKTFANGTWFKIGNVQGSGTINTPVNYSFADNNLTPGSYSYRIKQTDYNGKYKYYDFSGEVIVGIPFKYSLSQNFPNPFNPVTNIKFDLPVSSDVSVKIYNTAGKEIDEIVNAKLSAGTYTYQWNALNVSSGVYFYRILAADFTSTKKMLLLK